MIIKKIHIWDDSKNRGYDNVLFEIVGEGLPENHEHLSFSIERPGYEEAFLIDNPGDKQSAWSGGNGKKNILHPESSAVHEGSIILFVGPGVVRQMMQGNYVFRLIDFSGRELAKRTFVWNVRQPPKRLQSARGPSEVDQLKQKVQILRKKGDLDGAMELVGKILELAPDDEWALQCRTDLRVIQEEENLKILLQEGYDALKLRDYATVREVLAEIDSVSPGYPPAQELRQALEDSAEKPISNNDNGKASPGSNRDKNISKNRWVMWLSIIIAFSLIAAGGWWYFADKEKEAASDTEVAADDTTEGIDSSLQELAEPTLAELVQQCRNAVLSASECTEKARKSLAVPEAGYSADDIAYIQQLLTISEQAGDLSASSLLGRLYDPSLDIIAGRKGQPVAAPALAYDKYLKAVNGGDKESCRDMERLYNWLKKNKDSLSTVEKSMLRIKKWNLVQCQREE